MELSSLNEVRLIVLLKETNNFDEVNYFVMHNYRKQNRDLREAHMKSLNEMEELKRFQGSTFDTFSRRKIDEDQDTINKLTGRIQELRNEVHCMNDSIDF